ncbi:hypothetical protein LJR219_002015 [Phenylobacterium sp. LjRoot219]|uniref:hypothetical protein n=1 Tax=Phenylobacterium sp. LjRoot219 TaxID=3342283 RepID=UPI003ECDA275
MDVDSLSPPNRDLLMQALPNGRLVNVLYDHGARVEAGFARDRRCFALGERGWLEFLGWDGQPTSGAHCLSNWGLTRQAQALLVGRLAA